MERAGKVGWWNFLWSLWFPFDDLVSQANAVAVVKNVFIQIILKHILNVLNYFFLFFELRSVKINKKHFDLSKSFHNFGS